MKHIVEIEKLDHFARGIARLDGKIVFIPNALKGDVVEIEITKENKNFLEAKIINFIKKTPRRGLCPYSDLCGGCGLINLDYKEQLEFKREKIYDLFKRNLGLDINIKEILNDEDIFYRNKIVLHANNKKIGFYKEESHEIVEIDKCVISSKKINDLIERLKKIEQDSNVSEVMIRDNKELMLCFKGEVEEEDILDNFNDVDVIFINDKLIKGSGIVYEEILGKKFIISPKSFFQVNTKVCSKIFDKVRIYVKDKNYSKVLDLYCGTGVIGIIVSDLAGEVIGIEVVEDAVKNAITNSKLNNINNVSFICDKVENRIDEFKNIDLIIVDPPRSGLDKKSISNILRISPKDIIYISCNPTTLVRDLKDLSSTYEITEVSIADMFPNTYHVETVCILSHK